ncbi:MAG: hypothetical protein WA632_01365 [Gallionella sp.]
MHTDFRVDQADGLRKLLLADHYRVITLLAGKAGLGRTSAIISLASALAGRGKSVLVLDENNAPNNISSRLRLPACSDFLDVLQGRCKPGEAVQRTGGYAVMSTARAIRAATNLQADRSGRNHSAHHIPGPGNAMSGQFLTRTGSSASEDILLEAIGRVDLILVDAAMPTPGLGESLTSRYRELVTGKRAPEHKAGTENNSGHGAVSSRLAGGSVLVIMVDGTHKGITEGYASIKCLALEHERIQFGIVVNKVRDELAAVTVYENMARLARRDLAVRLELLGWIPRDENIKRANQLGKPLVDLFPASASALSYFGLAQKLSCLPLRQEEAEGGAYSPIHDLINQSSQTQYRYAEKLYTL